MKLVMALLLVFSGNVFAEEAEEIMGYTTSEKGVTFQVFSGGCTDKEHFEVLVMESFPLQLRLMRNKPDLCLAHLPYGTKITFSWDDLSLQRGDQFTIANKTGTLSVGY